VDDSSLFLEQDPNLGLCMFLFFDHVDDRMELSMLHGLLGVLGCAGGGNTEHRGLVLSDMK
jgi:hypothetical protein